MIRTLHPSTTQGQPTSGLYASRSTCHVSPITRPRIDDRLAVSLFISSPLPLAKDELNSNLEDDGEQKNTDHHSRSTTNHVWRLDAEIHNHPSEDNREKEDPGFPPGSRSVNHII